MFSTSKVTSPNKISFLSEFGPRLDCFDEKPTSQDPFVLAPDLAKKVKKGRLTIFDDEEVNISPTHPLARKKVSSELSEVWTRKAEDLDWDSIMKSASTESQSKHQNKSQLSLDELTSLKLTKDWNVAMDSNRNTATKDSKDVGHARVAGSKEKPATPYQVYIHSPLPPYSEAETSTTGLEDSRMTFPLHDLTGVVRTKKHEKELMKYMGVNNLDFTIARRYAPKDNDDYFLGKMKNGFFHAYAREDDSSKVGIEKMFLDPKEAKAKEVDASINALNIRRVEGLARNAKAGDISQLIRQLIQLKANLLCITMDGHATTESADRMVRRANDWFHQMLDDLEKRIKDERRLDRQYRRRIKFFLKPIIDKLCDLELLYETLDFLEKRLKANNETTTLLKENMRNARRMLAKLTALDYKRMLPEQPHIETSDYTIAAEASTAFHLLEQSLLHIMPFVTRSSVASSLIDTITSQMQGIHKSLVKEVPRYTLSEYNARLTSTDMQPRTNAMFLGIPPLEAAPRSLFGQRRRRKYCSHIKLDPWPTEVSSTTDPTALSSTEILSAKISTLPLSDFHESEMSNTPTEASMRKNDFFESFKTKIDKNLSEDRPPTVISPYTPSDKSICKSFEDAQLIRNFQQSKGATPTPISSSGSTNRAPLSVTRPTLSTSWTPTKSEIPSYSVPGLSSTSLITAEAEHSTTSVTMSANSAENPAVRMTPVIASVTSLPGSGLDEPNQTATPVITALTPLLDGEECEIMTIPVVSGIIAMPASDGENRIFLPLVASLAFSATKDGTAARQPLSSTSNPEAVELQTKPVISSVLPVNADDEQPARVLPLVTAMTPLSATQGASMMTTPAGSTTLSLRVNDKESPMPMPVVASNTNLPIANPVHLTANSTTKPKIFISSASTITRVPNVYKNANKYSKTPDPMRSHIKKGRNKIGPKTPSFENSKRVRRAKKIVISKELLPQSPTLSSALKTAIVDGSVHRIRANLN